MTEKELISSKVMIEDPIIPDPSTIYASSQQKKKSSFRLSLKNIYTFSAIFIALLIACIILPMTFFHLNDNNMNAESIGSMTGALGNSTLYSFNSIVSDPDLISDDELINSFLTNYTVYSFYTSSEDFANIDIITSDTFDDVVIAIDKNYQIIVYTNNITYLSTTTLNR
jgi:hypothetical protein